MGHICCFDPLSPTDVHVLSWDAQMVSSRVVFAWATAPSDGPAATRDAVRILRMPVSAVSTARLGRGAIIPTVPTLLCGADGARAMVQVPRTVPFRSAPKSQLLEVCVRSTTSRSKAKILCGGNLRDDSQGKNYRLLRSRWLRTGLPVK